MLGSPRAGLFLALADKPRSDCVRRWLTVAKSEMVQLDWVVLWRGQLDGCLWFELPRHGVAFTSTYSQGWLTESWDVVAWRSFADRVREVNRACEQSPAAAARNEGKGPPLRLYETIKLRSSFFRTNQRIQIPLGCIYYWAPVNMQTDWSSLVVLPQ